MSVVTEAYRLVLISLEFVAVVFTHLIDSPAIEEELSTPQTRGVDRNGPEHLTEGKITLKPWSPPLGAEITVSVLEPIGTVQADDVH
jgi:hypothetical protein